MSPLLAALTCLLTTVAMTAAAISERQLDCSCLRNGVNYEQVQITCGKDAARRLISADSNTACETETLGWVPSGYRHFSGIPALYKLYRTGKPYREAEEMCKRDGGHLAVPKNREQADAIAAMIKGNKRVRVVYIGINDIVEEGTFLTVSGRHATYLPFGPGQPDNLGDQDCLTINRRAELDDDTCTLTHPFVCQRNLDPAPPEGYRYLPQLGFYKYYESTKTYQGAKERCAEDGAHLAVLDTQEEAEALIKFYDETGRSESYIGLNDIAQEGKFVSETGKPLELLSFSNWYSGEPNNGDGVENCVTLHYGGTINDVKCHLNYPFFCEMPLLP